MYWRMLKIFAAFFSLSVAGCGDGGGGGEGLNGSLTLTAKVEGTSVTGNVTYSNPQTSNLIGTEITIGTSRTDLFGSAVKFNTNNSGSTNFLFTPIKNFDGERTFNVTASTGNLQAYQANLKMTGRTITMTPPANQTITVTSTDTATQKTIFLDTNPFVTVSDPIDGDIVEHPITIAVTSVAKTNLTAQLKLDGSNAPPATLSVDTVSGGTAPLAGATLVVTVPASGNTGTATITWSATDTVTKLVASGITTISITKQ